MSSQRVTFDPAQLPRPGNLAQRRGYIEQYIQHFHPDLLPEMALACEGAIFFVSRKYEDRGKLEAPLVYFEYMVDKTLWRNIFLGLGKDAPAWPWKKGPDSEDMSGGMSSRYREWRIKYGLPVAPQQEADTSGVKGKGKAAEKTAEITNPAVTTTQARNGECSKTQESRVESSQSLFSKNRHSARFPHHHQGAAPVPPAASNDLTHGTQTSENIGDDSRAALPEVEPSVTQAASLVHPQVHPPFTLPVAPQDSPLNAQDRIENPVVLDMAARQRFWETSSGGQYSGVIAGPFALNLPEWLDFERLVVGVDGRDIDAINNEILESAVAISWEVSGGKPVCLVVGFNDEARSELPQVQQHLFEVWCDMVAWFCSAVSGAPFSLAAFLRIIQAINPFMDRTPDLQRAQCLWQQSLAESDLFASRARGAQECFDFWSPMIREVIQQPLGVAEESLAALICSEEADSDERSNRFNVARDVWLSSSSDPKVICRASKWAQNFLANIQPSA
ncbi:hypothetical protein FNYG_07127 [Fusarium nygamai]|uniref:Uncharacterized protein n=1 Tax=Gibberella nygamai TaxID=42673 RepID=A0A2K0WBA0_GIBNY|nr:hypothetical protein FNYG_07127 [Fusarium nygamai]